MIRTPAEAMLSPGRRSPSTGRISPSPGPRSPSHAADNRTPRTPPGQWYSEISQNLRFPAIRPQLLPWFLFQVEAGYLWEHCRRPSQSIHTVSGHPHSFGTEKPQRNTDQPGSEFLPQSDMLVCAHGISSSGVAKTTTLSLIDGVFHAFLQDMMLEHGDCFMDQAVLASSSRSQQAEPELIFKCVAYLSSNKLLDTVGLGRILGEIQKRNNHSALREFLKPRNPTSDAFAETLFESAVMTGNIEVVQILLEAAPGRLNPSAACAESGNTPLQIALLDGDMKLARVLLDAGVDVNTPSRYKGYNDQPKTALHAVIIGEYRSRDMVRELLNKKADPNIGFDTGPTLLLELSRPSRFSGWEETGEIATMLLGAGANTEPPTGIEYETALQIAARRGNHDLVEALLSWCQCANVNAPAVMMPGDINTGECAQPTASALQGAILSGKIDIVRRLLDAGADVSTRGIEFDAGFKSSNEFRYMTGLTALQLVAFVEDDECDIVKIALLLLEHGANINEAVHPGGRTALQTAAGQGSIKLVDFLLTRGADVNAPACQRFENTSYIGRTAIQAATESGNLIVIKLLLKWGATTTGSGYNPLPFAGKSIPNWEEITRLLLNAGARFCPHIKSQSLRNASEYGNEEMVNYLIEMGADINPDDYCSTPLQIAARSGHNKIMRILLDAGADPNISYTDEPPLFLAIIHSDTLDPTVIRMMLKAGAEVNHVKSIPGSSDRWIMNTLPVVLRIHPDSNTEDDIMEIFQTLLDFDADINASAPTSWAINSLHDDILGSTALLGAVRDHSIQIIKTVLDAGAGVNTRPQPYGGWTPLQAAAGRGDPEIVQLLLKSGADINSPAFNRRGRTALQAALLGGHTEIALLFLDRGADISAPAAKDGGVTALQAAAISGLFGIARKLIRAGADPNAPPARFEGRTALEAAAEYGRLDIVHLLINEGAETNGRYAKKAMNFAKRNGHYVIARFLGDIVHVDRDFFCKVSSEDEDEETGEEDEETDEEDEEMDEEDENMYMDPLRLLLEGRWRTWSRS